MELAARLDAAEAALEAVPALYCSAFCASAPAPDSSLWNEAGVTKAVRGWRAAVEEEQHLAPTRWRYWSLPCEMTELVVPQHLQPSVALVSAAAEERTSCVNASLSSLLNPLGIPFWACPPSFFHTSAGLHRPRSFAYSFRSRPQWLLQAAACAWLDRALAGARSSDGDVDRRCCLQPVATWAAAMASLSEFTPQKLRHAFTSRDSQDLVSRSKLNTGQLPVLSKEIAAWKEISKP
ncbi:MAG: hypothetical protein FRX49_01832 [Trebouxia sp. A1-2]|nr:MAG: hypothetical protein FRX49_01832 [Trebouxia sp. A1-2]